MSKNKRPYEPCPLAKRAGGNCIFASVYYGTTRCFYGCGETIVTVRDLTTGTVLKQPNIECPREKMYRECAKRKREAEELQKALPLLEGLEGTEFA